MTKDAVSDWDEAANNNTDVGGVNIGEGWDAPDINNSIREIMAQIKTWSLGVPLVGINGLVPSNGADADHDIDFTSGFTSNAAGTNAVTVAALTKQFDAAFAKGSAAGGLGDGVSIPTSGTIHFFAIKEDSSGDGDIYGDTAIAGTNVPSGWTVIRRIFSITTTGSDNLSDFTAWQMAGGAIDVRRVTSSPDQDVSNLGTTPQTYTLASMPADIDVIGHLMLRAANTGASCAVLLYPVSALDDSASRVNGRANVGGGVSGQTTNFMSSDDFVVEDQQIKAVAEAASTFFTVTIAGWIDRRVD